MELQCCRLNEITLLGFPVSRPQDQKFSVSGLIVIDPRDKVAHLETECHHKKTSYNDETSTESICRYCMLLSFAPTEVIPSKVP